MHRQYGVENGILGGVCDPLGIVEDGVWWFFKFDDWVLWLCKLCSYTRSTSCNSNCKFYSRRSHSTKFFYKWLTSIDVTLCSLNCFWSLVIEKFRLIRWRNWGLLLFVLVSVNMNHYYLLPISVVLYSYYHQM